MRKDIKLKYTKRVLKLFSVSVYSHASLTRTYKVIIFLFQHY